jgi:hypothetical protein
MKQVSLRLFFLGLALAPLAFAQKWEIGAGVGGSFYTSQSFKNAVTSGDAGLKNGVAASGWLGNNSGRLLGGELRYDYERTDLKLSSGATKVSFGANTHALHYDFLLHLTPREAHVRPFVAAGGGIKVYQGSGSEQAFQPLSGLALLSKTSELKGLLSVGAGVKVALGPALQLRLEAHDYVTPFPKGVIVPAQGVRTSGWLQDFVAMAGLSFTF